MKSTAWRTAVLMILTCQQDEVLNVMTISHGFDAILDSARELGFETRLRAPWPVRDA